MKTKRKIVKKSTPPPKRKRAVTDDEEDEFDVSDLSVGGNDVSGKDK